MFSEAAAPAGGGRVGAGPPAPAPGKGRNASIEDELAVAVDRRRAQQAAVERGEGGATADPRLAREAELKRKQRERLIGKAAGSKKFGFSPRGTKKWGAQPDVGPTDVTV